MEVNPAAVLVEPAAFAAGLAVLRVPARRMRRLHAVVLAVLAAVSASAAVASGCAPTGSEELDIVLLAGLGAVGVLAGLAASTYVILVGAVLCAAAGLGSIALVLALAAVGLLLVSLLVEVEPLVDAAAAGLVVQAALRLTSPGGRGLTALVAAFALVPMLVSAVRTLEPQVRRALLRVGLGVTAFAVAAGVLGALAAASAAGPLRRGLAMATTTLDASSVVDTTTTAADLTEAGRQFERARGTLEAWWVRPAAAVPVVGQHWKVLRAAAITGDELAAAGRRALKAPALSDVRVSGGQIPLAELAAVEPVVADLAARATAARERLDDARSAWLVGPVAERLDTNLARVRDIERTTRLADRALPMVPHLLGSDEPRRYFLALQTPVEARGGGGFMGNFGEITAEDGRLRLTRLGRQDDLTRAAGRYERTLNGPPDFVARYARFQPAHHWANVNLSPDFPTTAQVIADLYPQSGGAPIDGVIAVDPAGLAALLSVVGPVEVPSWPTPITAGNALQTLLYDQYVQFDLDRNEERIDFLGDVAQAAWERLTSGDLPPVPHLLAALGPAVDEKHLFLASTRPDEQRLFEDMGAAGKIAPVTADFVGLVTQNAAGNKIDYFLRREVDYRVQLDPGSGRLDASVTVSLHNDATADSDAPTMVRNDLAPPLPVGTNKLYLSFYTPWELAGGRVDGTAVDFERATELGRRVYSTAVIIPPASTAVVELTLTGRLEESDDYRLDVYRQPMVAPDEVTATLVVDGGWRTANGRTEQSETLKLDSDATIEVDLRRG